MSSSSINNSPTVYISAVRYVRYHSVALLTALIWNACITFDDEVQYIWPMRNRRPFKWVYFFLRYGVIFAQTVHNIFLEPLTNGRNPSFPCDLWSAYLVTFTQILGTLLELILASRTYALYNRSRRVAFVLSILILAEVGATVRTLRLLPLTGFYGTCLLVLAPEGIKAQSSLGFIVHCTIVGLTLFKYFALRAGYGRSPLVSLVIRDGTITYAAIFFILVSVVVICDLDKERGVAVVLWCMSLASLLGCRLILSMERLAKEMSIDSSQPIFTSKFSLIPLDSAGRENDSPSQSPRDSWK